jgi:perosamine synthetase
VALAQVERLEELVSFRAASAMLFKEALGGCSWLTLQKVPDNCVHAWWAFVVRLDRDDISWYQFRDKYLELGGDGIYAAWMLSYLEPVFRNRNFLGREKLIEQFGEYRYEEGLCPTAEVIQPRLLQFKTNYWDLDVAEKKAKALRDTIAYFGG